MPGSTFLAKLAGFSALAAGAATIALAPGAANAQVNTVMNYTCSVFGDITNTDCAVPVQLGDKKLTFRPDLFSFSSSVPGTRDVNIRYSWLENGDGIADNDFSNDGWLFEVKAPDGEDAFGGPFVLSYGYDVEIVDGLSGPQGAFPPLPQKIDCGVNCDFVADGDPWYFNRVRLEVDANQPFDGITQVTKFTTADGQTFELSSVNGQAVGSQFFTLPFDTKKITIQDTITLDSAAVITSVTNSWNQRTTKVPGPLSVLGVTAAFGFSRRLKKRISLNRCA
jgi:hypothetical protein